MGSLAGCMAIVDSLSDRDADSLLESVDRYIEAGLAPADAQRAAAVDFQAQVAADDAEARGAIREQFPELFRATEPAAPKKPRVFSDPAEQAAPVGSAPTYISRPVANATDLHAWAEAAGITDLVAPEDMHVTIAYSRQPFDAGQLPNAAASVAVAGGKRAVDVLGDEKAVVLRFDSPELQQRWQQTRDAGASWDYDGFKPHVTLSYTAQEVPAGIEPYRGALVLGPEKVEALDTGEAPLQSRSLEEDLQAQQQWLDGRAKELGFENIDQLVDNDFDAFTRLAEQWREDNPAEVLMARTGQGFSLPAFGKGSAAIEALQNRYNRWKQTVDAVREQGGAVSEAADFYRAEERYWGKVASRIEDFGGEIDDFIKQVAKDNLTLQDVQIYAYAKHAKERNAYLRTQREANARTGFDSWSGMTDDEADEILQAAKDEGVEQQLESAHQTLMRWTAGSRQLMVDEGLITQDEFDAMQAQYQNYVPLKGKPGGEKKSAGSGTGKGFSVRGKETERARGRYSMASDIIEHVIQDRVRVLTRAGKNEVARSFGQFVLDNPDPTLWRVNAVETRPIISTDENGNTVIEEVQRPVKGTDRTVSFKDGGRTVYIEVLDDKLREQLQNLNAEEIGKWYGYALLANRTMGKLYTALSPTFTLVNFARDAQAAAVGMVDEAGFSAAGGMLKRLPEALKESFKAEFGTPSADYQLYRATGGKTGFMQFREIEDIAKELGQKLVDADRSPLNPLWLGPALLRFIEKVNGAFENATRFASWQAARAAGKSLAEASSISKNITVNFNRKGTLSNGISAWVLFFNPAVQGTARIAQALKSPKVLATLGAGMTGVAALALLNASMGGDDDDGVAWWDKIPQETKDRNLIFILPPGSTSGEGIPGSKEGRYVKIPMPYGWNWFATIANQAADLWRHGQDPARGVTLASATKNVVTSFLGAFVPAQELARGIGNADGKSAILLGVPDFLSPVAQAALNVNAFGRKMYPDDRNSEKGPDSQRYFAGHAGTIFQRTATALNENSGGTKYTSGWLDFTPATLENLARGYGGGPASFALDLMNAVYVRQSIERPDLDVRRLPFMKQAYGVIDAETDRVLAFDRMDEIDKVVGPVEAARKAGDRDIAKMLKAEAGPLYQLGGKLETVRTQLADLRKQELAIIGSNKSEAEKYARIMAINERKRHVMQRLNAAYNDAMRSEAKKPH